MRIKKSGVTSLQAIGYKELFKYFDGEITFDKAVYWIKQGSRNYAKRQFTWFRSQPDITWLNLDEMNKERAAEIIAASIKQFILILYGVDQ